MMWSVPNEARLAASNGLLVRASTGMSPAPTSEASFYSATPTSYAYPAGAPALPSDPAARTGTLGLPLFMALSALMMFAFGLMIANFTALAMEPQGHIAGTASSLYGSITTLLGIGVGVTIGQDYDGTLVPFATGFFLCTLAALAVVLAVEKGRLFRSHSPRV